MTELVSVRQLMERTKANHEFIRHEQSRGQHVYEVTQLLNSFLGAFAHPWEEWKKELSKVSLEEAMARGWPEVEPDDPRDDPPRNLGDLLRLIRNGLMHGNVRFIPDENSDIRELQVWNQRGRYRTWGATLDVETLRRFLDCFERHAETLPARPQRQPPTRHIRDRPTPPRCETCGQVIQLKPGQ
jgi:HEPN pEK499 p136